MEKKLNIDIKWIHLLIDNYENDNQDEFFNCIYIFINIIRRDKLLNEKLQKLGDEHPINKSINKNLNDFVNYCFAPQNFKQSLFPFFANMNEQIKAQIIKIIKKENE